MPLITKRLLTGGGGGKFQTLGPTTQDIAPTVLGIFLELDSSHDIV
jgi:hypothetical protein